MTSLITLSTNLADVSCLLRGHLIVSVRGVALKATAMKSVGLKRLLRFLELPVEILVRANQ